MRIVERTSAEWAVLIGHMDVYDPDGWDRKNWQFSWHEERITAEEYIRRVNCSTRCFVPPKELKA